MTKGSSSGTGVTNTHGLDPLSHYSLQDIAISVLPVTLEEGPAKVLNQLASISLVPVIDPATSHLIRVIRDIDFLRQELTQGWSSSEVVTPEDSNPQLANLTEPDAVLYVLKENDTLMDAKNLFQMAQQAYIPILDDKQRYTGWCASRKALLKLMQSKYVPPRIGGLATPLGVYMTSGVHSSGAGVKGLWATGGMFALFAVLIEWSFMVFYSVLAAVWPDVETLNFVTMTLLQMSFMFLFTLSLIRFTPIAGLHAAEHMTINAIENGLDLTEENVRRQPREHLRCGTNLMVILISAQIGWFSLESLRPQISMVGAFLYLSVWIVLVSLYWRKVGLWLQRHFTTRPPTSAQLASGIKAGVELLEKYKQAPHKPPGFLQKIWGAGFFQMIVAFALTYSALEWLLWVLNHEFL
ncbi:MAG: DUF1385 domain-containing protein [Cyanobacteria bacterium]|nr:DUF1385 domain-containing protein [Cyanobacteriota bacterium]